jgi:hypothetical protein
MYRKLFFILVIVLPLFAFMAVPGAGAACGEAPGFGIDWSGCDKSGEDLSGVVLGFMNLTGTDFTGAILTDANMALATADGAIFTNATLDGANLFGVSLTGANFTDASVRNVNMQNTTVENANFGGADLASANMTGATEFNNVSFAGASIPLLNLGNTTIDGADFAGSSGSPLLGGTDINNSTCPNGSASLPASPFCNWVPTAITLSGIKAMAMTNVWPLLLTLLLLAGTAGVLLARRNGKTPQAAV